MSRGLITENDADYINTMAERIEVNTAPILLKCQAGKNKFDCWRATREMHDTIRRLGKGLGINTENIVHRIKDGDGRNPITHEQANAIAETYTAMKNRANLAPKYCNANQPLLECVVNVSPAISLYVAMTRALCGHNSE